MDKPSLLIVDYADLESLVSVLCSVADVAREADGGCQTAKWAEEVAESMRKKYGIV